MAARIVGVGKYLPSRVLTNADLESMVETSNEWIVDRTGIRERRLAAEDETTASLGSEAAKMALETAGLRPDQIDLIICATCSPDGMFPASASLIQEKLGANNAAAFDINAACTGFLAALATVNAVHQLRRLRARPCRRRGGVVADYRLVRSQHLRPVRRRRRSRRPRKSRIRRSRAVRAEE